MTGDTYRTIMARAPIAPDEAGNTIAYATYAIAERYYDILRGTQELLHRWLGHVSAMLADELLGVGCELADIVWMVYVEAP
jgi:hypothetical protein